MTPRVYLDWNATAPLRPQARAAVVAALDCCGNPSSVHAEGRAARRLVEEAREKVAALVGAKAGNVVFTSGGTEANALALGPALDLDDGRNQCERLLVSAIEHPSVLMEGRFSPTTTEKVPVRTDGQVDVAALAARLAALGREGVRKPLVSLMLANNETGVIQPISEAARVVHEAGGLLHVDAIQGVGRIPCDINELEADLLSLSGHKLGAPKGVGALVKRSETLHFDPLIRGGGQERGARAGTENVAAIAGFGAAAAALLQCREAEAERMRALRDRLEASLRAVSGDVTIFGAASARLPNTTLFAVPGMKAETAVIAFDLEEIAVSSGSACSSGKVQPSHVLAAMGVPPELAQGAVRVSLGPTTAESDLDWFQDAWIRVFQALIKTRAGIAA